MKCRCLIIALLTLSFGLQAGNVDMLSHFGNGANENFELKYNNKKTAAPTDSLHEHSKLDSAPENVDRLGEWFTKGEKTINQEQLSNRHKKYNKEEHERLKQAGSKLKTQEFARLVELEALAKELEAMPGYSSYSTKSSTETKALPKGFKSPEMLMAPAKKEQGASSRAAGAGCGGGGAAADEFVQAQAQVQGQEPDSALDIRKTAEEANKSLQKCMIEGFTSFEQIEALSLQGANLNTPFPNTHRDFPGMTLLQTAFVKGDGKIFCLLLQKGANPNPPFPSIPMYFPGMTLLQAAFVMSYGKIFCLLLEKGANPNTPFPNTYRDFPRMTLLQAALVRNDINALHLLLKNGANLNTPFPSTHRDFPEMTLVQAALVRNDINALHLLLENGAKLDTPFPCTHMDFPKMTLLQAAFVMRYGDALRLLLEKGANPNPPPFPGTDRRFPWMTLAQAALARDDINALHLLLENGVNPNPPSFPENYWQYPGMTLLQAALVGGYRDTVRLLLEKGANPNIPFPDTHREFPGMILAQAAFSKGYADALKELLQRGADPNKRFPVLSPYSPYQPYQGKTISELALEQADGNMLRVLLDPQLRIPIDLSSLKPPQRRNIVTEIAAEHFKFHAMDDLVPAEKPTVPDLIDQLLMEEDSHLEADKQILHEVDKFIAENNREFTRVQIIKGLKKFLISVQNQEVVSGAPSKNTHPDDFRKFYETILARLQKIFKKLEDDSVPKNLKQIALLMIFNGSRACGVARFQETRSAYLLLYSKVSGEFKQMVEQVLYHFRKRCFMSAMPDDNAHTYNAYMRSFGETYGIADKNASYDDPLAPHISDEDAKTFKKRFQTFYTPHEMVQYLYQASRDKQQIGPEIIPCLLMKYAPCRLTVDESIKFQALQQKKTMLELRKTALHNNEEKRYHELEAIDKNFEAYEEQVLEAGKPTEESIYYLLMAMGIFKPNPLEQIPYPPLVQALIERQGLIQTVADGNDVAGGGAAAGPGF